jgi:FkbM family methyltransferase
MKKILRKLLKRTPLNTFLQQYDFWKLTEEDERRLRFYQQFIKPGELVYDVGANVGNRTKAFLLLQAKVIAFEPQQGCAAFLEKVLNKERNFALVKKALGSNEGEGKMLLGEASVLSTLSEEWVQAAKESGRFDSHRWNGTQPVLITTLDKAIQDFGIPSFIKIDVEGFEFEVLSGLSKPVDNISIEFASENIEATLRCIDYIDALSPKVVFQISRGESMTFDLASWVSVGEMKKVLSDLVSQERLAWGDIYIRSFQDST